MASIINFPIGASDTRSVEEVLQGALDRGLKNVIVLGYTPEGHEYCATSEKDAATASWIVQRFNHRMLEYPDSEEE